MRSGFLAWVVAFAAGLTGPAAPGQDDRPAPFERLDNRRLADVLARMGMMELLGQLKEELGAKEDSPESLALLAEMSIGEARRAASPAQRLKLLDAAIACLAKAVETTGKPKTDRERLDCLRTRLKLAEARALLRAEQPALKALNLQAGPEDLKKLGEWTAEGEKDLRVLAEETEDLAKTWRVDLTKLVTVMPELEGLRAEAAYKHALACLYRAMALEAKGADGAVDKQRQRLLEDAIYDVERLARGRGRTGLKLPALLLMARANRELKEFAKADAILKTLDAAETDRGLRIEAMFEQVRNDIEHAHAAAGADKAMAEGLLRSAEGKVRAFVDGGTALVGAGSKLQIDVRAVMLKCYLCETWAAVAADEAQQKKLRAQSQQALLDFVEAYPEPAIQSAFFEAVAGRYAGVEGAEDNVVVQLAKAVVDGTRGGGAAQAKAADALEKIVQTDTPIAAKFHPIALWHLGLIRNRLRQNAQAGAAFTALARKFPENRFAFPAAKYAVFSCQGVIEGLHEIKRGVSTQHRLDFIAALELLLGNPDWAGRPDVAQWHLDLGWQYEKMAEVTGEAADARIDWLLKAVGSFEKVPAGISEHMQAAHRALEVRVELLAVLAAKRAAPETLAKLRPFGDAEALRSRLVAYGARAAEMLQKLADRTAERARDLAEWGARAEFQAGVVEYEHIGRTDQALTRIRALPQRWPGTRVLQEGAEFEIRKLIGTDTPKAIRRIREFEKQYAGQARGLISLVIQQIRRRIGELRRQTTPQAQGQLQEYRAVYYQFARELYRQVEQDPSIADKYPFKQMLAEACLEAGQYEEAKKLFQDTAGADEARRKKAEAEIENVFAARRKQVEAAGKHPQGVAALAWKRLAELPTLRGAPKSLSSALRLRFLLAHLKKVGEQEPPDAKEVDEAVAQVLRTVQAMDDAIRDHRKRSLPVDASNLLGLARAERGLRRYADALQLYTRVLAGIDAARLPAMFWQTELEYCKTVLDGFGGDPEEMKRLAARIRQLELRDQVVRASGPAATKPVEQPVMGGLYREFQGVRFQAERQSR